MNRKNLFLTLGAAALALAIAVPAAFSHGPDGREGGRGGHGMRFERMAEKLGLNEQQVAKLKVLREDHQDDVESLRGMIASKRDQVKQLWLAATPNKQAILAGEREITALEGQLAEARVEFMFGAKQVLTADQFKQFVEMKGRHGKHGHGGKGGWGRGMGGGGGPDAPDAQDVEQ